jgi:glycosyltransferase involved in cell wall biosynthesis
VFSEARMTQVTYSFVIPVLNEEPVLRELHKRLAAMVGSLDGGSEFVFVDDGSQDQSSEVILELGAADPRVKLVSLSRNFGHQVAISAGLDYASGSAIVIMDADLQDPPEVVPSLVERWKQGYAVVYAIRKVRPGDRRLRRWAIRAAYKLLARLSDTVLPLDAGDFRLVDRRVVDIVRSMPESSRYLRGMFAWVGFKQTGVTYERPGRFAGTSKYSAAGLVRLAVDGLLSFSTAPLRLTAELGIAIAVLAFCAGIAAFALKLLVGIAPPGWASLTVILSFFMGTQLIVLGTIGLYIGRIFEQSRGRPLYLVSREHGFSAEELAQIKRPEPPPSVDELASRSGAG